MRRSLRAQHIKGLRSGNSHHKAQICMIHLRRQRKAGRQLKALVRAGNRPANGHAACAFVHHSAIADDNIAHVLHIKGQDTNR